MTTPQQSHTSEYFDAKYRAERDPWDYAGSSYEMAKYAATLTALPRTRYTSALEIGCSIGVFTRLLAGRCDRLLAIDTSATAVAQAKTRCHELPQVWVERRHVPEQYPSGTYDLVVVSEVGYYLSLHDLIALRERIIESLQPGGHLVLVHWTPDIDDALLTGDAVHDVMLESTDRLRPLVSRREDVYRLDVLERRSSDDPVRLP